MSKPILQLMLTVAVSAFVSTGVTFLMMRGNQSASISLPPPPMPPAPRPSAELPPRMSCARDQQKLCSPFVRDDEREICLQDNFDKLEAPCRADLQKDRDRLSPCEAVIKKNCAQAGYGGGRMKRCLLAYLEDLPEQCRLILGMPPK